MFVTLKVLFLKLLEDCILDKMKAEMSYHYYGGNAASPIEGKYTYKVP